MGDKLTNGVRGSSKWHSHMNPYAECAVSDLQELLKQEPNQPCLNEQYGRNYIPGRDGADVIRFISCPCPKCTPRC